MSKLYHMLKNSVHAKGEKEGQGNMDLENWE